MGPGAARVVLGLNARRPSAASLFALALRASRSDSPQRDAGGAHALQQRATDEHE